MCLGKYDCSINIQIDSYNSIVEEANSECKYTNLKVHVYWSTRLHCLYPVYEIKGFTFPGLNSSIFIFLKLSLKSVTCLREDKLQHTVSCLLCRS